MTPAAFAAFLRTAFALDTWYTPEGARRALRRVGCPLAAEAVVGAARRAGWVIDHPTLPGDFLIDPAKIPATTENEHA